MEWKELQTLVKRKIGYGIVQPGPSVQRGVPIIKVNNIISGLYDTEYLDKTTVENDAKYQRTKLKGGELIVTVVGTCGKTAIVPPHFAGCNLVRATCLIDIEDETICRWIKYYIDSPQGQAYINRNLNTTVQATLNVKNLNEMPIPFYSKEYTSNVVKILSSLDRKIELNNKINADLEEMAQAIFKNWFVDFEPFKDGKFVDSELGMIPEGWKVGSPYKYVKVVYGAPYKSAKFNDNGEGLPLIRIRDLKDCNPQFYTPEILPQTEYVNMGDIVAGMDAEFVPHIWKGNTGLLNQRVCKLMPQQTSISNLFVLYLMKPELEFVQSYKTGTTVSHLGKADIDKFVVVLPPLKVVEECSKILDSILQRIKNISAESRNLSTLRDTLLPRLMSGELEVPE